MNSYVKFDPGASTQRWKSPVQYSFCSRPRVAFRYFVVPITISSACMSPFRVFAGELHNPPKHAPVRAVDEKSQIQALDRGAPGLPVLPVTRRG
jgi:hypothetical protein